MGSCALMYLVFKSFDCERTWWRWFQNGVVCTNVFGFQIFRLWAYLMKVIPVMGQKSSLTNKFPYIFHIKPWLILILIKLFLTRFHEILSIKSRNRYSAFMTYQRVCNKSNKTGATQDLLPFRRTLVHCWFLLGLMLLKIWFSV